MNPGLTAALLYAPPLLWLYAFYRMDRHEPEPLWTLFRTFLAGMVAFGAAAAIEHRALPLVLGLEAPVRLTALPPGALALAAFAVIGPVEELVKFAAAWVSVGRDPEYDEPVDGVVYMAAAALGFSLAENLYLRDGLDTTQLAMRGVFSCFLHASCSGLVGYWWSEYRYARKGVTALISALCAAAICHGLFDLVAFGAPRGAFLALASFLALLDMALMHRVSDALARSPYRHPELDTGLPQAVTAPPEPPSEIPSEPVDRATG